MAIRTLASRTESLIYLSNSETTPIVVPIVCIVRLCYGYQLRHLSLESLNPVGTNEVQEESLGRVVLVENNRQVENYEQHQDTCERSGRLHFGCLRMDADEVIENGQLAD